MNDWNSNEDFQAYIGMYVCVYVCESDDSEKIHLLYDREVSLVEKQVDSYIFT